MMEAAEPQLQQMQQLQPRWHKPTVALALSALLVSALVALSSGRWNALGPGGGSPAHKCLEPSAKRGRDLTRPSNQGGIYNSKIPKILHHIWIGRNEGPPEAHDPWMNSCKSLMVEEGGWEYRMWGFDDAVKLIAKHDVGFLNDVFLKYPLPVYQSDALRYFIMKDMGGLYLDTDIECWREGSSMLKGIDVAIGSDPGPITSNAAIASMPGHPLWNVAIDLMRERGDTTGKTAFYAVTATGPLIVRDAIMKLFNATLEDGHLPYNYMLPDGSTVHLYPLGQWYFPCGWGNKECHLEAMLRRITGQVDYSSIVGYHRWTSSWSGKKQGMHNLLKPEAVSKALCEHWNRTAGRGAVQIGEPDPNWKEDEWTKIGMRRRRMAERAATNSGGG